MTADIIDISTRKKWSPERVTRAARILGGANRAGCTAPYLDLLFLDEEEDDGAEAASRSWPQPR